MGPFPFRTLELKKGVFLSLSPSYLDLSDRYKIKYFTPHSTEKLRKAKEKATKRLLMKRTLELQHSMAIVETNVSLQQPNPTFDILNHNSILSMMMMDLERGPRYEAYAELRETKLRMKYMRQQEEVEEEEEEEPKVPTPPPRKQVKFHGCGRKGSSLVAQSVPDFSSALRKENRKPVNMLPTVMELTPPSKSFSKGCGVLSSSRGSKSANAGEKRRGGGVLMARKSYATIDELKCFSSATANAINGETRGAGRNSRVVGRKTVLGYRQL